MSAFDVARRDALELLAGTSSALEKHGSPSEADAVRSARSQLLDGRVTAIVVGEYKRGKSSLVGALIEDPGLFPINVDITTSLVTSVEYAAEEQITVFRAANGASTPTWITRGEIPEYVTEQGNPNNAKAARLLRIQTPNQRLREGLVLMDTPGAGGLNTAHTAVTLAMLGSADVAIFVIDALTPMTVDELTMLETTARLGAKLLLVVTKSDKVVDHEVLVQNARAKLTGTFGTDIGISIPIIPVSSTAKLDWLASRDPDDLADSNFEELDGALWGLLGERSGALLLARALSRTIGALDSCIAPLRAELVGLTASDDEVQAVTETVQAERDELAGLGSPGAPWRTTLVDKFAAIRDRRNEDLERRLTGIRRGLDADLAAGRKARREDVIVAGLERDVTLAWTEILHDARSDIANLCDEIESLTGLSLNPGLTLAGRLTAFDSFGARHPVTDDDRMSGLQAAGIVGEVIGWLTGFGALYVVGDLLSIFGIGTAKAAKRQAEFERNVRDQFARAERELHERIGSLFDGAEQSVTTSYERMIHDRRGSADAAARALRSDRGESGREREVRSALAELTPLRESAADLAHTLDHDADHAAVT